ncbi:hypothetical protein [Methanobrevibacter sp.]
MKYDGNRNCNRYELTVLKLLYLIAKQNYANYNGNERAYLHNLKEELEE